MKPDETSHLPIIAAAVRIIIVAVALLALQVTAVPLTLVESVVSGRQAAAEGRVADASPLLVRASEYQPWVVTYVEESLYAALRAERWDVVESDLQRLSAFRPLTADEYALLGVAQAEQGQQREAIKAWEQAEQAGTGNAEALTRLLEVYIEQERWPQAINTMRQLLPLRPNDANLRYELALREVFIDPQAAQLHLREAASLEPDIYAYRISEMDRVLTEWAELDPWRAYARLGAAFISMNELELAEDAFNIAIGLNPAYAEATAYYGYLQAVQGQESIGAAQQAYRLAPESPTVLYLVGQTWVEYGELEKARQIFFEAFDIDPDNPAFPAEIAATYQAQGAYAEAEEWFEVAVDISGNDFRFVLLLAQFYVDAEYQVEPKGLRLAEQLVDADPQSAAAWDVLGWGLFLTGDIEGATEALSTAIEVSPGLARAHAHYGTVLAAQGDAEAARAEFELAVTLDPFGPWGAFASRSLSLLD